MKQYRYFSKYLMFLFAVFFLLGTGLKAAAQEISFEASVDTKKATLDSTVILVLSIAGVQNVSALELPAIDGFKSRYVGPSTSISIVNGQSSSSVSHQYLLYPQKLGTYQIPALTLEIQGKEYTSQPIDIEIVESIPSEERSLSASQAPAGQDIGDRVFLRLEAEKARAYVREAIPVRVTLYVNNVSLSDIQFPRLNEGDFTMENFDKPVQYQKVVDGINCDVVEFNTVIYPDKEGALALGPAQLACSLIYKRSRGRSGLDQFDVFSNSLFDDFFGGYEKYPFAITSSAVTLDILPLPTGAPPGFSSAVGRFNFKASASPLEVNVGDPITIKMTLTGQGDLKAAEMPSFKDSADFKVYEPQITQQGTAKVLEQVLVPTSDKVAQVPEIVFSYFDTTTGTYAAIRQGPFALTVHPSKQPSMALIEAKGSQAAGEETFGRDIVFIKENPGVFYARGALFKRDLRFFLFILLYAFVIGAAMIFYKKDLRMKTDVDYARRLRAPAKVKQGMRLADSLRKAGKEKEFYDTVYKILQQYFSEKFLIPEGMATEREIEHALGTRKIPAAMIAKIQKIFFACDTIRYGGGASQAEKMDQDHQTMKEIIDFFERI